MLRRPLILLASLFALIAMPTAVAGAKAHTASTPTVSSVSPMKPHIGDTLTVRGKGFLAGKHRNTVVFLSSVGRAVFVKDHRASHTKIQVVLPKKLAGYLKVKNGLQLRTRFRVRVLAKRFGRKYTTSKRSPLIAPKDSSGGPNPPVLPNSPEGDCDHDGIKNKDEIDDDNDLLPDTLEKKIGTDPCSRDTDGDGVEDGYEYESALDLNSRALPYPGKRPYPNALDPSDANIDHDGDSLTLIEEYQAWIKYGHHTFPLNYSDGTQSSGGPKPEPTGASAYLDTDHNGLWTDDEKDVDGDGLSNYVEQHGPLSGQGWWTAAIQAEHPYTTTYAGTDWLDPDTDGDGLKDGADDNDFDGVSNKDETFRITSRVQPFNPCLPDLQSPTCSHHPPFDSPYPPYDSPADMQWLSDNFGLPLPAVLPPAGP